MKYFLGLLLLLVVCVAAFGYYRGWFSVEKTRDPDSGQEGIQFKMDRTKITPDIEKVKDRISGGSRQTGDKQQEK
jgi:hypothetical protein